MTPRVRWRVATGRTAEAETSPRVVTRSWWRAAREWESWGAAWCSGRERKWVSWGFLGPLRRDIFAVEGCWLLVGCCHVESSSHRIPSHCVIHLRWKEQVLSPTTPFYIISLATKKPKKESRVSTMREEKEKKTSRKNDITYRENHAQDQCHLYEKKELGRNTSLKE